ncbi:MAG: HAMP domain-containing histidine kinase [Clostridia bacterium]|nr:HAMP domain-containing histidine kinase [Clostridia bacterium]
MKTNYFSSIRFKFIFMFIMSGIIAFAGTIMIAAGTYIAILLFKPLGRVISLFVRTDIAVIVIIFLCFLVLFIVTYLLFTQRSIRYIEEISASLRIIAEGNLDYSIPIRSKDELAHLAENINSMTFKLRKSIEEERCAEKTKNDIITSVSHDLRTPLTSILGYLGLVANDKYRDEVELRYYIDIAYNKSQKLKKLIDELFEYTRLSSDGFVPVPGRVSLNDMLEQLAEEFVPVFDDAGMKYRLFITTEKAYTYADGDMLVRVFENLISNAVRYGRDGKYVDIELFKESRDAVVRIINYGKRIPEEELPYIFEKFYRIEKSRSENTGGTGLGLAIAKNIVELHKGRITAYSQNDRTVFETRLSVV